MGLQFKVDVKTENLDECQYEYLAIKKNQGLRKKMIFSDKVDDKINIAEKYILFDFLTGFRIEHTLEVYYLLN